MELQGKKVLITGANRGIGEAIAYALAQRNMELILTSRTDTLEPVKKKCEELGSPAIQTTSLDLSKTNSITHLKEIIERANGIDILINNAGITCIKNISQNIPEEIEHVLRTNLEGVIKLTTLLLPHTREAIVNIGSGAGTTAFPTLSLYCASKFGLRGFTRAIAQEDDLQHLKIYLINPGGTQTRMNSFRGDPPERVAYHVSHILQNSDYFPTGTEINIWEKYA